jgi:hypothetical protein
MINIFKFIVNIYSAAVFNKILGAQSGRTWSAGAQNCQKFSGAPAQMLHEKVRWKGWGAPSSHVYLSIPVRLGM